MKRFIRRWKGTPARWARVASMLAKCSEILFWLVAVGPFALQSISRGWWVTCVAGLLVTSAGSDWYSRKGGTTG